MDDYLIATMSFAWGCFAFTTASLYAIAGFARLLDKKGVRK